MSERLRTFAAVVTDIKLASRSGLESVWWLALDSTEFRAGDTGLLEAVTRSGTRLEIRVSGVAVDEDGVVWHVVEKPLAAGTDVQGRVDTPEPR